MAGEVVHIEIPADDVERVKGFYSALFGWSIKQIEGMDYWLFAIEHTKPMGGGIMKRQSPGQVMTNYFDVPSVDAYSAKVIGLGGKIIVSKMPVPGMGYFAVCLDTEGNSFGLWEDNKDAK